YRLPTEAEWEYACRAGTTSAYHTGDELPEAYDRHQEHVWQTPEAVSLQVGVTPPNQWGLYDMHGNVEEWCSDWYGPYESNSQTDPVGRESGTFKVTRGGSHHTTLEYLRSANRLGTLPEDCHWLIGFRVVMGERPDSNPLPQPASPLWASDVHSMPYDWSKGPSPLEPYFEGPIPFVHKPEQPMRIPMYPHNHCPSITWCDNGDLLAVWFSTKG
ncbi:MAG TPA: formylglycine-generating enzyme family protein, partial [bacterium]|nr:formylglycine-generating enzyme family protein [bacterium]